jgi:5-methylcytosine-specific restriction protein B
MSDLDPPEQIGADQGPEATFRFHLSETPVDQPSGDRPFVLFDAQGRAFKPVLNHNRRTGRSAYRIKPPGASNKAAEALEVDTIAEVARAMLVDGLPARIQSIRGGQVNYLTYSERTLIRYELDAAIAREVGVPPRGQIGSAPAPAGTLPHQHEEELDMPQPINLILYGPPGTGKTHATAAEAVRLCGELVPTDRNELMAAYRRLSDAGRIEFVTFHQSTTYEDFVEGLRPTQTSDTGIAGFELKPEPGVFRRIVRRAETSTGPGDTNFSISGRQIFKMSIGEAANPDDAYLFEEAIAGGYTLLGFEDIDWSDKRFADRAEIITAVRSKGVMEGGEPNAMSGRVQMPFIFRNWMKRGDIVVVSKGNSLFRAIGQVTGDYQFAPREGGDYGHRRAVKWLWVDRAGVPVSEIYARNFTQKSIYLLTDADLNVPALERYIASQQDAGRGAPEPFVLIIDEINRANISKVLGELITLLEPDKRLGQPNAVRVRLPYSGDLFGVPANLHIVGTMNTADRSIALLDTALRRRFEFRELMPDSSLLGTIEGVDLAKLLTTINERIEYLFDREHQIGHAYFLGCRSRADIDSVMRYKVIPLLAEYFYEDWAKVAAVLGDAGEGNHQGRFLARFRLKAPKGMDDDEDATPRWRWSIRDTFSYDDFAAE